MLPRALEMLQEISEAESSLSNLQQGVRGALRIGVIPTIMPYWIAPRIRSFCREFPEVEIQLSE